MYRPGIAGDAPHRSDGLRARLQAEIGFLLDCFAKKPEEADLLLAVAFNTLVPRPVRDAIAGWSTNPEQALAALRRVKVPTLITHGLLDRLILPRAAEMTAAAVKGRAHLLV